MEKKISDFINEMELCTTQSEYLEELKIKINNLVKDDAFKKELRIHNALSKEPRFAIYKMLEMQGLCTCVLAEMFNMSEGSISHHLKILENAGLIIGKKVGRFTVYYTKERFMEILNNQ
ncbi:MAG: ArsR/SmtB family transcription factor [Promethearchaeota archaeon]